MDEMTYAAAVAASKKYTDSHGGTDQNAVHYTAESKTAAEKSQARTNIGAASETDVASKLTEPTSGMAVGKYFRIASIDESGHAVLEAVDAPSSAMKIKFAGTAQTPDADGYVDLPKATNNSLGIAKGGIDNGWNPICVDSDGKLMLTYNNSATIMYDMGCAITGFSYKYAVKYALGGDRGIGVPGQRGTTDPFTDTERLTALLRLGCTVDSDGFVKWTATPTE